jgi:hypothetical protein
MADLSRLRWPHDENVAATSDDAGPRRETGYSHHSTNDGITMTKKAGIRHPGGPTAVLEIGGLRLLTDPGLRRRRRASDRCAGADNVQALDTWQWVELATPEGGVLRVTAVPARHGPPGCEPMTGEVTGFALTADELPTVYLSGGNAELAHVRAVADRPGPADVAGPGSGHTCAEGVAGVCREPGFAGQGVGQTRDRQ